jgi:hypothetical protein
MGRSTSIEERPDKHRKYQFRAIVRVLARHTLSVALPGGGSGTLRINRTFEVCGAAPGAGAFAAG